MNQGTSAERPNQTTPEQAAAAVAREVAAEDVEAPTPPPRAAVIYNPIKVDLEVLKAAVSAGAETAGWRESLWLETSAEDAGQGMAREALEQQVDLVIAAGGDGTVRAAAEVLAGTGVPLALLPSGTGNLLARNLKLSLSNLEESVAVAFTGEDRRVDTGVAEVRLDDDTRERHVFVVMAGLGLDAQLAQTDDGLKKKIGWLAYVHAITRSIIGGPHVRMRWSVDGGHRHTASVHTLLIGNCGSLPGNVLLLPDAAVDDGLLDFVAMRPEDFVGWMKVWGKVLIENGLLRRHEVGRKLTGPMRNSRAMRYQNGRSIDVQLREPQDFELDGDPVGKVVAFRASVDPGSLLVRLPRS